MSILVPYSRSRISSLCLALWGQEKGGIIDSSRDTPTTHFTVHNFLVLMARWFFCINWNQIHWLLLAGRSKLPRFNFIFSPIDFPYRAVVELVVSILLIVSVCVVQYIEIKYLVFGNTRKPNHSLQFLSDIDSNSRLICFWDRVKFHPIP